MIGRVAGAERRRGWASLPHTDSDADVQKRLELMGEAGVEVQVLSHGMRAPYLRSEAVPWKRHGVQRRVRRPVP